jgi:hypothetical protein
LEVHRLTPEGLQGVLDVPLYGRVAALQLYRPASEPRDLLLLLTERNKFCVLGFDEDTGARHCLRPSPQLPCIPCCRGCVPLEAAPSPGHHYSRLPSASHKQASW